MPAQALSATFFGIGFLPGANQYSQGDAVSADGRVVVGHGRPGQVGEDAILWTRGGGIQYLGDLPGGDTRSLALDASADGQVIVGHGSVPNAVEAFRWTQPAGMQGLGFLNDITRSSTAVGVSADGSVIVGLSSNYDPQLGFWIEAFRWTENGGMLGLGEFPGGPIRSQSEDVSGDGSIVVGTSNSVLGSEAFRWTEAEGMAVVGDLPGGIYESFAAAISENGRFIVGASFSDLGQEAYRWDAVGGMLPLGILVDPGNFSTGLAVSDDGVVVGTSGRSSEEAFIWTEEDGIRNLRDVLVSEFDVGERLEGWTLTAATDITPDGRAIVGYGINPDGNSEGWVFTVPEPSSIALLALALAGVVASRRRL